MKREELFLAELTQDNLERWNEATVDLSRFSGRQLLLSLSTEGPDAFDPAAGLPLWGHPEVVAPR